MKRVGFFLNNEGVSSVNCKNILNGNPGIGGSEYMIVTIAYLLSLRENDLQVRLYSKLSGIFPDGLDYSVVSSFPEAVRIAENEEIDFLVFKHDVDFFYNHALEGSSFGVKLIPWCHVFLCSWELDYYSKNSRIYRIVNVGREQNDLYRDHLSFRKSTFIYNCVNMHEVREKALVSPICSRANVVTFVGNIIPCKGFHLLAKAWPDILKQVPDAELYVIGSGKLYDESISLGHYGIAQARYEEDFMPYLTQNGEVLPSVHFMGLMGAEKENILLKTKVGVPNPSGVTETFGLSAVEMQMMGANVVTMKCPGYIDTVINGRLYSDSKKLASTVIDTLKHPVERYDEALDYFDRHFSYQAVVRAWEELLLNDRDEAKLPLHNSLYRGKYLKEWSRRLRKLFPILYYLPPLERIFLFMEKVIKGRGGRYIDYQP